MAAGGNPGNVQLGPGRLYYAPIGTAEPTSASALLPSANWQSVGYTESGTTFTTAYTDEDIFVAEEFDPVANQVTGRTQTVGVEMAEATKRRLLLALGGGATAADDNTPFEFPDASAIVPVMLVWDSDLGTPTAANVRYLFRKCTPSGTITRNNNKAPNKRTFQATFKAVKPDAVNQAVKVFPNASGQV